MKNRPAGQNCPSELPGFGQFDFDPQLDLGQDRVEPGIAGGGFQVGGGRAQPVDRGGVEIARQQPEFEVIQHVERTSTALHRTFAALGGILNTLQRQQRIDAAGRLGRGGGAGLGGGDRIR